MTKEELIGKVDAIGRIVEGTELVRKKLSEIGFIDFRGEDVRIVSDCNIVLYRPESGYDFYHVSDSCAKYDISEKIFLSWLEGSPKAKPKKRGPKPKPNKRERAEANLKQIREDADKAEKRTFRCMCVDEGHEIGTYRGGKYTSTFDMTPKQALAFAKWVLDLEGK